MTNAAADEGIGARRLTQTAARPESEHPAPWDCREERGYVVCDARGDIVVRVAKASRGAQENLARAIASIPEREAEIVRLRIRNAELQSTIVSLDAELRAALKAAREQQGRVERPQTPFPGTRDDGDAPVAADVSLPVVLQALAGPWGRLPDAQATVAGGQSDGGTASPAHLAQPTI